jgi:hypothetical protein
MFDVFCVALVILFFAIALLFARGCAALEKEGD